MSRDYIMQTQLGVLSLDCFPQYGLTFTKRAVLVIYDKKIARLSILTRYYSLTSSGIDLNNL